MYLHCGCAGYLANIYMETAGSVRPVSTVCPEQLGIMSCVCWWPILSAAVCYPRLLSGKTKLDYKSSSINYCFHDLLLSMHYIQHKMKCMLRCSQMWHRNCRTISLAKLHYTNWIKTEAVIMSGYRGSMHLTNPSCWAGRGEARPSLEAAQWDNVEMVTTVIVMTAPPWPRCLHHHIQQQHNSTNNITTSRGWALDSSLFRMVLFKHIYIVDCHSLNNHVLQLL